VVDPGPMVWRSDQAAVAVVSALVYRHRLELTIHGRTRTLLLNTPEMLDVIRLSIGGRGVDGGLRLGALGAVLDGGGMRSYAHAFTASASCELPESDLVVFAEWPALRITYGERRIPAEKIRTAAGRVADLWAAG
jgi:hypothetical protein